jgi:hypothetical protein
MVNLLEKEAQLRLQTAMRTASPEPKMDKTLSRLNNDLESAIAEKDRLLLE